jgi:hypothetical protein
MYRIHIDVNNIEVALEDLELHRYVPFDPANTDYQKSKSDVLAGAELQDANGVIMSQLQAEAFIKELP